MVQGGVSEVQNFLAGQGLNADVLANDVRKASGTASDALTQAKPTVDSTVVTLSRSSPALLAEYALGAVALYYFVRPSSACLVHKLMLSFSFTHGTCLIHSGRLRTSRRLLMVGPAQPEYIAE